jgi:putative ABC transport system permease protein
MITRLSTFAAKTRSLLTGRRMDREFDEELEAHLDLLAERFVREGMAPDEARYAALRQFGNVTSLRETRTEMRTFAPLQTFGRDLRYGARLLRRSPGWTLVAVLTLTLGIGATTAIFSLVQAVLLTPLPYPAPDRLVVPATTFTRLATDRGPVAYADVLDWKAERGLFEAVTPLYASNVDITDGAEPERVPAIRTDDAYFAVLGSAPLLGRFFTPQDNLPTAPRVVVLSHSLWNRRFGGDPHLVGKPIELSGVPATIIGVTRPDAIWPSDAELIRPLGLGGQPDAGILRRDNHAFMALARLRPGVSIEQAQAKLTVMATAIAHRDANRADTGWKLHALDAYVVGPSLRRTLWVILGAALLVLLIACVNVANLLLARGLARQREIAVRAALGAGRRRIAAQFIAESALLSAMGGVAGVVIGYWCLKLLVRFAPPDVARLDQAQIDVRVLAFSLGLCLVTTVLAGVAPAFFAARVAPMQSFHEAGRALSVSRRSTRLRNLLVVSELALALVLLTVAGLLVRSVSRLGHVEPGIVRDGLLTMEVSLPQARYATEPLVADGFDRLTAAIRLVPGVIDASAASSLPIGGGGNYLGRSFLTEGQPEPPASADTHAYWTVGQPGYFGTLGIPILEGRAFTSHDTATSTPVIIISRAMAKAMFPSGSPLGKRIRSWRDEDVYREIVGVAGDVRYESLAGGFNKNVYVPHTQDAWSSLTLVVRTRLDPPTLVASVRHAVGTVDKKLALSNVRTMEQVVEAEMARPRLSMSLLVIFGLAALALAAVGIYGIVAYAVTERTREIGIRMALGAVRTDVVAMVVWKALRLAAAGLLFGSVTALALTRVLESLLFEVEATDPVVFGAAALLLLGVVVAAACIPAARASRVDPVTALRGE